MGAAESIKFNSTVSFSAKNSLSRPPEGMFFQFIRDGHGACGYTGARYSVMLTASAKKSQ
jgi:hypothetical protein